VYAVRLDFEDLDSSIVFSNIELAGQFVDRHGAALCRKRSSRCSDTYSVSIRECVAFDVNQ
jgi:hypothetical protein